MSRKRFSAEQIVNELREVDVLLAAGRTVAQACKQIAVTEQTYTRWRREYRGMKVEQTQQYHLSTDTRYPLAAERVDERWGGDTIIGHGPAGKKRHDLPGPHRLNAVLRTRRKGDKMPHRKPHVLFILTDQLRADCVGCAGHDMVKTPNIDRLAAEGVRFTDCFTSSPLCVPSRDAIVTGLYPHNSNLWQNGAEMPLDADTYMKSLKEAGYRTCSIGKNHLFYLPDADLYEHGKKYQALGFDHIEDMPGTWMCMSTRSIYTDHLHELGMGDQLLDYLRALRDKPDEVRRFIAEPLPIPAEHYMDAFIARRVTKYIDEYDSEESSFVFVGFQGPHEPWDAPEKYYRKYNPDEIPDPIPELAPGDWLPERCLQYQRWAQYYQPERPRALKEISASYFGKITQIDDSIGQILAAYERKGWLDNTVIIFTSDHGEMLGDLGRLSKSVFYESAVRVPLIVRLPGGTGAGTTRPGFVETIDVHGTILDLAGAEISGDKDCLSVLPVIHGSKERLRNDILSEVHVHYMLRTEHLKIVVGRDGATLQLFDLQNDPLEQRNLCSHPDYVQQELEMRSRLLTRIAANTRRPGKYDPGYCK